MQTKSIPRDSLLKRCRDAMKNRIMPLFWQVAGDDAEFPEDLLDIFNVRNVDRDKREEYLLAAISHYKPDLVIIDGVRELQDQEVLKMSPLYKNFLRMLAQSGQRRR